MAIIKAKSKTKTDRIKANPYSGYWKKRADEAFMSRFRGRQCAICGTRIQTCGHHLIAKQRCNVHRYTPENILVLCVRHHMMDSDISAHSISALVVERFLEWLKTVYPDRYEWIKQHEHDSGRINYRDVCEQYAEAK